MLWRIALVALPVISCAPKAAPSLPIEAPTQTTSATVSAPRPMQTRTIGSDPYATPAQTATPATTATTTPSRFYPPTLPVNGNMNPSPPES